MARGGSRMCGTSLVSRAQVRYTRRVATERMARRPAQTPADWFHRRQGQMSRMSRTASTALMIMVGCGWLASACGRSPIGTKTDARIDGGTGGATTGGGGGSGGGGGTTPADGSIDRGPDAITPADAPVDRPDGAADLRDGPPDADRPDLVTE